LQPRCRVEARRRSFNPPRRSATQHARPTHTARNTARAVLCPSPDLWCVCRCVCVYMCVSLFTLRVHLRRVGSRRTDGARRTARPTRLKQALRSRCRYTAHTHHRELCEGSTRASAVNIREHSRDLPLSLQVDHPFSPSQQRVVPPSMLHTSSHTQTDAHAHTHTHTNTHTHTHTHMHRRS
jgi:hypothetical protein